MFGYMEFFYIGASFGRLLLTKVKFTRSVKKYSEKSLLFPKYFTYLCNVISR